MKGLTLMEMQALLLATELETAIKAGLNVPLTVVVALNQLRKAQEQENKLIGRELEEMYKNYIDAAPIRVIISTESN